ncbi:hypothetical protein IGI04_030140, partial [Brassica rapa subsp. trilocularis]
MSFNVSMNLTKLGIKILVFLDEFEKRSKNRNFGALRASNWLFMLVSVLMAMTILEILGEDEDDK